MKRQPTISSFFSRKAADLSSEDQPVDAQKRASRAIISSSSDSDTTKIKQSPQKRAKIKKGGSPKSSNDSANEPIIESFNKVIESESEKAAIPKPMDFLNKQAAETVAEAIKSSNELTVGESKSTSTKNSIPYSLLYN